jgi:hypothetical protein
MVSKEISSQVSENTEFLQKAYSRGWIKTIEDLETAVYGMPMQRFLGKADAPVLSSTTGARNVLYGQRLWRQVVVAANAFGALGFKPWEKSGYRAITAAAATTSPGVAENGALPDTIKPTFKPIDVDPTTSAATFDQSDLQSMLEGKDDTIAWADLVQYMGDEFKNRLNRAALATADTVPTTGIESLDRIVGSYAELAYGKVDDSGVLDAGDLDIYGQDRDASASWADAYVNGQAFGSGSRDLALSHIDATFTNCRPYWNGATVENKVIITGYDTLERIQQLIQAQQRFVGTTRVQMTVNGVQTVAGTEAGFDVSSYKGVPIIPDNNVLQDTLSRIYTLDLDNIHVGVLSPIQYLESGDFFANDKIGKEGLYYMHGEIVCTKFKAQGKVRDLQ